MSLVKDRVLIVKFFKKGECTTFASQVLSASDCEKKVSGRVLSKAYWGTDFTYDKMKGWSLKVEGKDRKFSVNGKLSVNSNISLSVHTQEKTNLASSSKSVNLDQEGSMVPKIHVLVQNSRGNYMHSDILRNRRTQKVKFAGQTFKVKRPKSSSWESIYNREGLKLSVRKIMVPQSSEIRSPAVFDSSEKKLIKRIAVSYVAAIGFFLISYALGTLISDHLKNRNKYDVVKVDENFIEERRKKLFKEKKVVLLSSRKVKKIKSENSSKKIVKGFSKKRVASKKRKSSGTSGPKSHHVRVQGIKSDRMKIGGGRSGGSQGHRGQKKDKTVSKISNQLSALSQGIGFNSRSKKSASHLYKLGQGGSVSSLKKGFSKSGKGLGFGRNGSKDLGSYKVGGLNTNSLGGFERSAGTGGSLSAGQAGRGYIDGIEEEIVIVGGLDRSVIKRIIRKNLGDINYCYERRLNVRPHLSGTFEAKFSIGANGQVLMSSILKSTLRDSKLDQCIKNSIKSWRFPKPLGGTVVNVNYPFVLKSS